jgi:hypothetical protein
MTDSIPFQHGCKRKLEQEFFPASWIGLSGLFFQPAHSTGLYPLDFFIWGYFICLVLEAPLEKEDELPGIQAEHLVFSSECAGSCASLQVM